MFWREKRSFYVLILASICTGNADGPSFIRPLHTATNSQRLYTTIVPAPAPNAIAPAWKKMSNGPHFCRRWTPKLWSMLATCCRQKMSTPGCRCSTPGAIIWTSLNADGQRLLVSAPLS